MKPEEALKRRAHVDALCGDFISKALERAVRSGDTDAEVVTDAPELRVAEENCKRALKHVSPLEMLTVNGSV